MGGRQRRRRSTDCRCRTGVEYSIAAKDCGGLDAGGAVDVNVDVAVDAGVCCLWVLGGLVVVFGWLWALP